MKILLPELNHPEVRRFCDEGNHELDLQFATVELQEAMEQLKTGEVDGLIVGATHSSADVIRSGLRTLGTKDGLVSSFFIMKKESQENLYFADCAVNPDPDSVTLAKIAEQTCENVIKLGEEPVVAFLSYSTEGSARGPMVVKMQDAFEKFTDRNPGISAYGELQFDSAWDESVYNKKTGKTFTGQHPNVFIFPDLNVANIAYKITERLAGYTAVGPILQGFTRPLFDLSRGVDAAALREICITVDKLIEKE